MLLEYARVWVLAAAASALGVTAPPSAPAEALPEASTSARVHGVTISTHTSGREWGSDAFANELDALRALGVNWVAIHPYAGIRANGSLSWPALDPAAPPEWIARPIREAHARGMSILIVPHVAQWGSPWRYRGEIDFTEPADRDRFFDDYARWITAVAACARDADGFSIASELDRLSGESARWRRIIAGVRGVTKARLTLAASWSCYGAIDFWDALDAIGVQAYFPLSTADDPSEAELRAGWQPILADLRALHERTGKPVVFTELGYNRSLVAAREPWDYAQELGENAARAEALQVRCLASALAAIDSQAEWLRGALLWKWFVRSDREGRGRHRENFLMSEPSMRATIAAAWAEHDGKSDRK